MEMPTVSNVSYTNTAFTGGSTVGTTTTGTITSGLTWPAAAGGAVAARAAFQAHEVGATPAVQPSKEQKVTTRIVKVFIADTNENLPLDKQVIYKGEEKLTDSDDRELFFEVPIQDLLATHNAVRLATKDKKQSEKFGKDIMLEAARIRDLKMVVVTVASF